MMREAKIIIPETSTGHAAIKAFENSIVDCFGGFTMTFASGAWKSHTGDVVKESVRVYVIAAEDTSGLVIAEDTTYWNLRGAVLKLGRELEQDCVYLKHTSGEVQLINTKG